MSPLRGGERYGAVKETTAEIKWLDDHQYTTTGVVLFLRPPSLNPHLRHQFTRPTPALATVVGA